MTGDMSDTFTNMFKQASDTFQNAMQTGTKFQQEAFKAAFQPFFGEVTFDDIGNRSRRVTEATLKLVQKNFDESQRMLDSQCRQSMDMLKKAFDAAKPADKADLFETTRKLWQESLDTMRTSIEQMAKTNAQVVENFSQFMTTSFNGQDGKKAPAAAK